MNAHPRIVPQYLFAALCLFILLLSTLRVISATQQWDLTYDEYWHLLWSERALLDGNFDREYANFVSTTPITMLNAAAKEVSRRWGETDGERLAKVARIPTIFGFLTLLGLTFALGRKLASVQVGLIAVVLTSLDANVITHASITTVDVFFSAITLWFLYQCIRFVEHPSVKESVLLGITIGIAFSIKLSAVLFLPTLLFVLCLGLYGKSVKYALSHVLLYLLIIIPTVAFVVSAFYLFHGVGFYLNDLTLHSSFMQSLSGYLPFLYIPLPEAFVEGFDLTLSHERAMQWNTVIFNQYYSDGVWYYFPVTWFFKTPIAVIVLLIAGIGIGALKTGRALLGNSSRVNLLASMPLTRANRVLAVGVLILLFQWLIFFVYFNFVFRTHVGLRYIVMCLPMSYLIAAIALKSFAKSKYATAALSCFFVIALLEHLPYWNNGLSFSNQFIADKKNAYHYLTDSNIDWGQNYSEVMRVAASQYPGAVINPPHVLPGENIIRLNYLTGVFRNFEQHRWARENLSISSHLLHTHLLYNVTSDEFREFLNTENRARAITEPAACPSSLSELPHTIAAESTSLQTLCIGRVSEAVEVRALNAGGIVGTLSSSNPGECQGYRVGPGQVVVYGLQSEYNQLCFISDEAGSTWEVSPFSFD